MFVRRRPGGPKGLGCHPAGPKGLRGTREAGLLRGLTTNEYGHLDPDTRFARAG
jgi:hypothetical protein